MTTTTGCRRWTAGTGCGGGGGTGGRCGRGPCFGWRWLRWWWLVCWRGCWAGWRVGGLGLLRWGMGRSFFFSFPLLFCSGWFLCLLVWWEGWSLVGVGLEWVVAMGQGMGTGARGEGGGKGGNGGAGYTHIKTGTVLTANTQDTSIRLDTISGEPDVPGRRQPQLHLPSVDAGKDVSVTVLCDLQWRHWASEAAERHRNDGGMPGCLRARDVLCRRHV